MSATLVIERQLAQGVKVLELNDPERRNAMSESMAERFSRAVAALREDDSVRVVVLTGSGKAFSAGGDLDMLMEKVKIPPAKNRKLMELFYANFLSLRELEVPVIAAINGHAVGAGLCLALSCDIRIASEEAKLGLNFVHLGLHPGMGATYFLPRLVGPARAAELLYEGKIISATEAATYGIVNKVVSAGAFSQSVLEMAQNIASVGPQAVRQLRHSLELSPTQSLALCLRREAQCQAVNYANEEFFEGVTAAKEKRKPNFATNSKKVI